VKKHEDTTVYKGTSKIHHAFTGIVNERSSLPESLKLFLRKNPCSCINCRSNNEGSCAYTHITGQSFEFDKKSIVASKAQKALDDHTLFKNRFNEVTNISQKYREETIANATVITILISCSLF
jgi:hypothetical protein